MGSRSLQTLILCLVVVLAGCAHRTVTLVSDPPGAFVYVFPHGKLSAVTPGSLKGLRASRNYTVIASLKGYDTARVIVAADSSFPWPFPINFIIMWSGGYDETVEFKLYPCSTPDSADAGRPAALT